MYATCLWINLILISFIWWFNLVHLTEYSFYPRSIFLPPQWKTYSWVSPRKILKTYSFPVSQAVPTRVRNKVFWNRLNLANTMPSKLSKHKKILIEAWNGWKTFCNNPLRWGKHVHHMTGQISFKKVLWKDFWAT